MKLSDLFANFSNVEWGSQAPSVTVSFVTGDSRGFAKNKKDFVFVAIRGTRADGHSFLAQAANAGAVALIVEDRRQVPNEFNRAVVVVENSRRALDQLAARFFNYPSHQLFCAGVTGTNGKTTITHMIEAILNEGQMPTGVIGTIDHHLKSPREGQMTWSTDLTTPGPVEFQGRLRDFVNHGARALAMEVSSIGLEQSRCDEVDFDAAVFSNLSRDHMDLHGDMEKYFLAKLKLFNELLLNSKKTSKRAIVNLDDQYGQRIIKALREAHVPVWTYGVQESDLAIRIVAQGFFGTKFVLTSPFGEQEFSIQMPGLHNVLNAVAAIGAALHAGVSLSVCQKALANFNGVKGRLESVENKRGLHVFVDYAHTDDALATVLHYLGRIRSEAGLKSRLITVFGCGGDRDRGKRPLMMKAAAQGSDAVVVTSDNPRTEDPHAILQEVLSGADANDVGRRIFPEVDRRTGIRKAIEMAKEGDVVLIAGKGHEDYQIIGREKHPFSDVEVVKEILS
jgi:UDP-N-acetylmuramoyl-L-alanyl-D-glutamate--2,6-diaminopimelate ligase